MFIKIFIKYYSAGVERLFSAAGRMMGDDQKGLVAETMKHNLALCRPTQGIVTGSYRLTG